MAELDLNKAISEHLAVVKRDIYNNDISSSTGLKLHADFVLSLYVAEYWMHYSLGKVTHPIDPEKVFRREVYTDESI